MTKKIADDKVEKEIEKEKGKEEENAIGKISH
jgi:hypothetical protein